MKYLARHLPHIFTKAFTITTILIAFLYLAASLYLMNYRLLLDTLLSNDPMLYKIKLHLVLLGGFFTALSLWDMIVVPITSILVALNVLLIIRVLRNLKNEGGLTLTVGAGSFLGIVSAGCASCGLSLLSLVGVSSLALRLPFHGREIQLASLALLLFSFLYTLKKLDQSKSCKI